MGPRTDILRALSGQGGEPPLYLPDLTSLYDWHQSRRTLPETWTNHSLSEIARALDVPVWIVSRPWRLEIPSIDASTTEHETERIAPVWFFARLGTIMRLESLRWSYSGWSLAR